MFNKVTFTEAECKLAKEGLDFLINKGTFELTGVEAFKFSKQIAVLSKVPALMEQYLFESAKIVNEGSEESTPAPEKKGKK